MVESTHSGVLRCPLPGVIRLHGGAGARLAGQGEGTAPGGRVDRVVYLYLFKYPYSYLHDCTKELMHLCVLFS